MKKISISPKSFVSGILTGTILMVAAEEIASRRMRAKLRSGLSDSITEVIDKLSRVMVSKISEAVYEQVHRALEESGIRKSSGNASFSVPSQRNSETGT